MGKLGPVLDLMNEGELPTDSPFGRWRAAQRDHGFLAPVERINEANRRGNLGAQIRELDAKIGDDGGPGWGLDAKIAVYLRLKRLDRQIALDQSENLRTMPPIFTDNYVARWQEDAVREQASKIPLPRVRRDCPSQIKLGSPFVSRSSLVAEEAASNPLDQLGWFTNP
ncbi:hypothetical protein [Bradyrhizobium sp. th.b2]|uniref:hypothetical protein n=1 Tax=Bradyrhizobium sp. th-b2 TaxID=172088 RepID=UPI00040DC3CE|nr:hypothetical protein [Bradyrhizobium sp. th.b2]